MELLKLVLFLRGWLKFLWWIPVVPLMNGLQKKVFILSMLLGIYITWGKCKKQRLYKKYVLSKELSHSQHVTITVSKKKDTKKERRQRKKILCMVQLPATIPQGSSCVNTRPDSSFCQQHPLVWWICKSISAQKKIQLMESKCVEEKVALTFSCEFFIQRRNDSITQNNQRKCPLHLELGFLPRWPWMIWHKKICSWF